MPLEFTSLPKSRLSKTSAEQEILRAIRALESEYTETASRERKKELSTQLSMLREQLAQLQGKEYHELETENLLLAKQVKELQQELAEAPAGSRAADQGERGEKLLRYKLYRVLLKKYAEIINQADKKTVGQIKSLITNHDLTIQSLLDELRGDEYVFSRDCLKVAAKAHEFLSTDVRCVKSDIDINFWLSPSEILSEKIGDDEDLAVLMCSIMYSLGDEQAEAVIAEMDDLTTHAFVITELNGKFVLVDPSQRYNFLDFVGNKEKILGKYSFNGAKIKRFLYKFNAKHYEQFLT